MMARVVCGPPDVATNDLPDVLLLPAHDLGDHALGEPGGVDRVAAVPRRS